MRTDASLDNFLKLLQIAGWIGVVATIFVLVNAIRSWRSPNRWVLSKFGDALTLLGLWGVYLVCVDMQIFACGDEILGRWCG